MSSNNSVISSANRTLNQNFGFEPKETVKVCLRIRPLSDIELRRNSSNKLIVKNNDFTVHLNFNSNIREYKYSYVFDESANQKDVFLKSGTTQLLYSVLEG